MSLVEIKIGEGMESVGKVLIVVGIVVALVGIGLVVAQKVPFLGRLPGDFVFRKGDVSFYFPLVTSIIISLLLTVLINIIFRIFRS